MPERRTRDREPAAGATPLSAPDAARVALRHVADLTGKDPHGVTSVEPADDDGWVVSAEVVEERRIPSSSDILALYEVEIDGEGELLAYRRTERYPRGRTGGEGGRS
ncbi:MAG: gas vesicle protein [Mycobacteriales bacterium]|jgi:hypothetical protein